MNYEVALVNPKTNKQKTIFVTLSPEQVEAAKASPCEQSFVQEIARTDIPDGFLPLGNGVRTTGPAEALRDLGTGGL